ncbi:hypothetical protein [Legionella waltersii]|uniref:Coiled-coil protein n=1 Tax=Legionella waltersii TaxID=66969 RepID=A0A0W1A5N6_9GAMM|nr:hypothetical protein [Legionella waltersii]KTD76650.1 hypothetical protein Lwal_2372 [Legionella waltersii]SNU94791.1 Uncharacterised protein [Legionella waltersii]
MTPLFIHLTKMFPELQALEAVGVDGNSNINHVVAKIGPEFYTKIIGFHPHLNMEYSILCQKIRHDLTYSDACNKEQLVQEIKDALKMAELLEYLNLHYLIVPREVRRLRNHKKMYRELLTDIAGIAFTPETNVLEVDVGWSLSQLIREDTGASNWYRILLSRTNRILNAFVAIEVTSEAFALFMARANVYLSPFLAYLGWCFFIPRLSTNLFLLLKHLIPNPWMDDDERSIRWTNRLLAQLQRRWFELANDSLWCTVGLLNCFLLVGPLAPIGVYLTIGAFVLDVVIVSIRAYIELNRLHDLRKAYQEILNASEDEETRQQAKEFLNYIDNRIQFEHLRSGLAISGAVAVVAAMCLTMPLLVACGPLMPFVGAVLLIMIWAAMYILTNQLEQYRPKDAVEKPSSSALSKLSLFAKPEPSPREPTVQQVDTVEMVSLNETELVTATGHRL